MLHGARSFLLQDEDGQTIESHSISAGLDYPGVGPEHAYLAETGRATYVPVTDAEAMDAFALLCRTEGIIPAIESAHALAGALDVAKRLADEKGPEAILLVNLSGRGDKDMETATVVRPRRTRRCRETGDRGAELAGRAMSPTVATAFDKARGDGRAALVGYLPAGFPTSRAGSRRCAPWSTPAGRDRGRPALQRPGHGRPDDPGRRPARARGRRPHPRRAPHGRGGRRDRRPPRWS